MSSSEPQEQQPIAHLTLAQAVEQIVRGLEALNNLAQIAMRDRNAQFEAQRQIGVVAEALCNLPQYADEEGEFSSALTSLGQNLGELAGQVNLPNPATATPGLGMSEEEAERRLSLTVPILREHSYEEAIAKTSKRRLVIASLEQLDSALPLTGTAQNAFEVQRWDITNLGHNVPIMALTSTVREIRPSVLVLVISRGQFIAETARLIEDLKKTFVGLKVVAVGAPFGSQPNLGERLGADLYAPEVENVAELAEQALTPLNRLSEPLVLSLEESEEEAAEHSSDEGETGEDENSKVDEVPTVKIPAQEIAD